LYKYKYKLLIAEEAMRYISGTIMRLRRLIRDRRGATALIFALTLIPLIGVAGVAIDYARLVHMKTTLQAAADAAAISGASANFGNTSQETAVPSGADGPSSIATNFFTNAWLPPNSSVTQTVTAPTSTSQSGATVTVTATAQVAMSLLAIWRPQIPVSVTATAVVSVPTSATGVFPFTLPACLFTAPYWNSATGTPGIDPSTGKPYELTMDSLYHTTNNCTYGQWTSFLTNNNSTANTVDEMKNGCGCTLSVGTSIYIQPGTKAAVYGSAAAYVGQTILTAVVDQANLTATTTVPIVGFAPFVIDGTDQSGKTITGHFASNYQGDQGDGLSGTGGTYYGVDTVALTN
jgi:Flp pilus assembly protein TadG